MKLVKRITHQDKVMPVLLATSSTIGKLIKLKYQYHPQTIWSAMRLTCKCVVNTSYQVTHCYSKKFGDLEIPICNQIVTCIATYVLPKVDCCCYQEAVSTELIYLVLPCDVECN